VTVTLDQVRAYARDGHVTVPDLFSAAEMDAAVADAMTWAEAAIAALSEDERAWYLDSGVATAAVLRKLDNPHYHRPAFRALAADPRLVRAVETLIGPGVSVYFSQIFFKPPRGGGPKPVHQDNFYFGPSDPEGVVTAWIALDAATVENGCLFFGNATNRGPVLDHVAPPDAPYDLQIPDAVAARHAMTPAPVPKGGVSFHHGNTLHRSSDNRSDRWRRACALHYVSNTTRFATPALPYDHDLVVPVSGTRA
jgi:ectoine hydroxylase-related dioxygenase (phytanoyl-CoA dioxygenase family)